MEVRSAPAALSVLVVLTETTRVAVVCNDLGPDKSRYLSVPYSLAPLDHAVRVRVARLTVSDQES